MFDGFAPWTLAAVLLFVTFLLAKSRISFDRDPNRIEGRRKLVEAKARARDARGDPLRRAQAFREASRIALEELSQPNLAASFARRAMKADPHDLESVQAVAAAMLSARRYRALEKLLWRRLDEEGFEGEVFERLIELYEGPMRRPEQARVLRALLARKPA